MNPDQEPDRPTELGRHRWWETLKRTWREFTRDNLTDWAGALTYYGILSIFPGLLVLVACLGLLGEDATDKVQETMGAIAPDQVDEILNGAIDQIQANRTSAGIVAIVAVLIAFW